MQGTWKGMMGALVLALSWTMAGCPAPKPCGGTCTATETCNTATNKCESVCPACQPGTGCNVKTASCENLCQIPGAPTCTAPETCDPTTGTCANKCTGVTCQDATKTCDPNSGSCVDKCSLAHCAADKTCVPTTGACTPKCETTTKPAGGDECQTGWTCQATTGECVPPCATATCSDGQWCEDATGACKSGAPPAGYPGTACTGDGDCHVPNSDLSYTCQQDINGQVTFPNGYCTAACSPSNACPAGSYCLDYINSCYQECTHDTDCANGYRCYPASQLLGTELNPPRYVCWPESTCTKTDASACAPIGGDCASSADCQTGDDCATETFADQSGNTQYSGLLGGYCFRIERGGSGGDTCPDGSAPVGVDQNDARAVYCLASCTLGQVDSGCKVGEGCMPWVTGSTTQGACWASQCSVDDDCQVATCSSTDTSLCGKGQTCSTDGHCKTAAFCNSDTDCGIDDANGQPTGLNTVCDTSTHTCSKYNCDGSLGQCELDCTALDAFGDTDGSCAGVTCDPGKVCDKTQPAGSNCVSPICPTGTTCNATTKKCDRGCRTDDNCGANAVCEGATADQTGTCVTYCTKYNEASLCTGGNVCDYATGHCGAKCTSDDACGAGERCDTASGHCTARCDADPTVCAANQYCDATSGACLTKCTSGNELTVCTTAPDLFCQYSTGKCIADCAQDTTICGTEACNVDSNGNGHCGKQCTTDSQCGQTPDGTQLHCLTAPDNANIKRCQLSPT